MILLNILYYVSIGVLSIKFIGKALEGIAYEKFGRMLLLLITLLGSMIITTFTGPKFLQLGIELFFASTASFTILDLIHKSSIKQIARNYVNVILINIGLTYFYPAFLGFTGLFAITIGTYLMILIYKKCNKLEECIKKDRQKMMKEFVSKTTDIVYEYIKKENQENVIKDINVAINKDKVK